MGRTIGLILIGASIVGYLFLAGIMFTPVGEGTRTLSAAVLGFGLFGLILLLPLGGGIYMLWQGGREAVRDAVAAQQRRLLNIVKTRGQIAVSELVLELNATRDDVQAWLYDLVGRGLFSGYVVWDKDMLYSQEASQLRTLTNCRNCNGQLELGGKGVIRCPYCGTEYFLD